MIIYELQFRCNFFWDVLKMYIQDMRTFKAPIGYRCKRIVSWNITEDNYQIEQCQGTFLEFVKWLVTHESFEITEKIKK